MGPELRRNEVESFALQQLDCVECKMHRARCLAERQSVINNAIIASNTLLR